MEIFLKLGKQTKAPCQLPVLGKLHSLSPLFFFPPTAETNSLCYNNNDDDRVNNPGV